MSNAAGFPGRRALPARDGLPVPAPIPDHARTGACGRRPDGGCARQVLTPALSRPGQARPGRRAPCCEIFPSPRRPGQYRHARLRALRRRPTVAEFARPEPLPAPGTLIESCQPHHPWYMHGTTTLNSQFILASLLNELIKDPVRPFPAPVHLGRRSVWVEGEVEAYMREVM